MFQRYSVFPHLTVLGNVLVGYEFEQRPFTVRLFGAARRRAIEKSEALIEGVGLAGQGFRAAAECCGICTFTEESLPRRSRNG